MERRRCASVKYAARKPPTPSSVVNQTKPFRPTTIPEGTRKFFRIPHVVGKIGLILATALPFLAQTKTMFSEKTMTVNIPFELVGANRTHIVVPVFINGKGPFQFLFDTGASTTILLPDFARELNVKSRPIDNAIGVGTARAYEGKLSSFSLGKNKVNNLKVIVAEGLEGVKKATGVDLKGAVGLNFMRHFIVTINYPDEFIRLVPGQRNLTPGSTEVHFPKKDLIVIPVLVNGRGPYNFAVQTGAGGIVISSETALALGLKQDDAATLSGVGGLSAATRAKIDTLEAGTKTLQNPRVVVVDFLAPLSQEIGIRIDGLLGQPFLKNFTLVINFPRRTITFR